MLSASSHQPAVPSLVIVLSLLLLLVASRCEGSSLTETGPSLGRNLTLCERLSTALLGNYSGAAETAMVAAVVSTAWLGTPDYQHGINVFGLANPLSPLVPLLQGSVSYRHDNSSTDLLGNLTAYAALASKLVAQLGEPLGCSADGFPRYSPHHSPHWVHEKMGIGKAWMLFWGRQLTDALLYWGAEEGAGMDAVRSWLNSFHKGAGENEICTQSDCPQAAAHSPSEAAQA